MSAKKKTRPYINRYDHKSVEKRWRLKWNKTKLDEVATAKAKKPFYNLMMFPYPSAEGLHVGNMYAFTGSDMYGRYKRMQGYDVFEPIGLDGFGIHSENYAFKVKRHPMEQADRSEANFYNQLSQIGAMYDWDKTVETYKPGYYKWTQWLFTQMFKHGLAYRAKATVNWCPSCKTVLADEQVIDGECERCGNKVEDRALEQWFFRITAYAEKLLANIPSLDWTEKVKIAQRNWIGKKEGINIAYPVVDEDGKEVGTVTCFTTRPDTNFGATFVVLAPEHPFVDTLKGTKKIDAYVAKAKKASKEDRVAEGKKKTGVPTGLFCVNTLNGDKMSLYISDFVIMDVGTGAVVGVPGHDKRDFEFAQAFDIPVKRVVVAPDGDKGKITSLEQVQEDEGEMVNSEFLNGMPIQDAIGAMMDHLETEKQGERVANYHLRDWLISRQRYWGPPIPMIYCKHCAEAGKSWFTTPDAKKTKQMVDHDDWDAAGWYPVEDDALPVELPHIDDYKPGDDGVAPLAKVKDFYEVECPGCGKKAERETDVSDTFLDSAWYFLRYPSLGAEHAETVAFDQGTTKKWLPVHMYTGGAEHSVLHLLYSRFVCMALKDFGYIDFEEPFAKFFAHGLVIKDGGKMSKSKGNVVNPDEYIATYGTDALRLYLMFMGPFSKGGDFRDTAMEGMSRWVGRVWRMAMETLDTEKDDHPAVARALPKLIKKVGEDIERRKYNTAIAAMMEFTNLVADNSGALSRDSLKTLTILLAPFAPHLSEELFQRLEAEGEADFVSVHHQPWPDYDATDVVEDRVEFVIQVNGKVRGKLDVAASHAEDQEYIEKKARKDERVASYLDRMKEKNVIFVPGKLINFVV